MFPLSWIFIYILFFCVEQLRRRRRYFGWMIFLFFLGELPACLPWFWYDDIFCCFWYNVATFVVRLFIYLSPFCTRCKSESISLKMNKLTDGKDINIYERERKMFGKENISPASKQTISWLFLHFFLFFVDWFITETIILDWLSFFLGCVYVSLWWLYVSPSRPKFNQIKYLSLHFYSLEL